MSKEMVEFEKTADGNLVIKITAEGREELADYPETTIFDLIDHQLCNGWDRVQPEEIGALTGCDLIISDDVERHEDSGDLLGVGVLYWHERYQIENPVEELRSSGRLVLQGVKS